MSNEWKHHCAVFETKRQIKDLRKQKGVKVDDIAFYGEMFRKMYRIIGGKDYYISTWRTKK